MCNSRGEQTARKGPNVTELLPKGAGHHGPVAVKLVLSVN